MRKLYRQGSFNTSGGLPGNRKHMNMTLHVTPPSPYTKNEKEFPSRKSSQHSRGNEAQTSIQLRVHRSLRREGSKREGSDLSLMSYDDKKSQRSAGRRSRIGSAKRS